MWSKKKIRNLKKKGKILFIIKDLKTISRKDLPNLFIYKNIKNNSLLKLIVCKKLLETFFYRKYLLKIYKNIYKFNMLKLINVKNILAKLFNKNINLNIINTKYLFIDNNIFLEAIVRKLKNRKRRVLKVIRKAISVTKVAKINPLLLINLKKINVIIKPISNIINVLTFKDYLYINKLKNIIFEYVKNTHVSGIRLEANGRLSKRLKAARSTHKIAYLGNIQNIYSSKQNKSALISRGFLKSNVDLMKKNFYY